jgi:hypothetical protein
VKLEPAATSSPSWPTRHLAGICCVVLGIASVAIAAALVIRRDALFDEVPDWRVTVPLWAAAAIAALVSVVRREGSYGLAVLGVALASAAFALGWVLVLAAVATVTLVVIYIMSEAF